MSIRSLVGVATLLGATAPLGAQPMGDESRLVVGIHAGYIGGTDLWSVPSQPVYATPELVDQFRVDRALRSNIAVNGQLHYYRSPNFGLTAELSYLGLGTRDRCTLLTPPGAGFNRLACIAIDTKERSASAVAAAGGAIFRFNSRGDVQPYLRGSVGLALVPRSTTAVTAFFPDPGQEQDRALLLYAEDGSRDAKLIMSAGFGLATSPRRGYQFRFEARMQGVQLPVVDGPTDGTTLNPPTSSRWIWLPTLTLGLDIVLEKRRGRRY
jgi:hypothetical protein